jgi:histone H3/H4
MAKQAKLPLKTVERILRDAGAKRVGRPAVQAFAKYLEDLTAGVAREAGELADHSGRKTITDRDIDMVRKKRGR